MKNSAKAIIFTTAALLIVFLIAVILQKKSALPTYRTQDHETVAAVGSSNISQQDILYKIGAERAYGNTSITRGAALIGLVNDLIEYEVAVLRSCVPSAEEISELKRHADATSKEPDILAKIKSVFGDDAASYDRIYMRPKAVNRKLHECYVLNKDIYKNEREKIEKAYSLAAQGAPLQDAAEQSGLKYYETSLLQGEQNIPDELRQYFPAGEPRAEDPLSPIIKQLQDGEIYKNIIEDDYSYKVIRLAEKKSQKIDVIEASKLAFEDWFQDEAKGLEIDILDASLKGEITANYGVLRWVKMLRP